MNNKLRLKEIIDILKDNDILHDRSPKNIRVIAEKLGPTFIKLGQIASTRVDLIPMEYCDELSKLRSEVTPLPYEDIEKILYEIYPNLDDIFLSINPKPIGSASIAQVHKAILKNGNKVVIKIRKPNIDEQFKTDIELMKEATNLLHLNHFINVIDLNQTLDDIYNATKEELDFKKEEEHCLTFYNNNKENEFISVPKIYTEYTTKDTLVMEEIKGIKINEIELLKEKYDLPSLAKVISDNYIKQAIDDGLFHADPHPDNIIVSNDKVIFIDWGMTGNLKPQNRELLKKCMKAIIIEDYNKVAEILVSMSKKTGEVSMNTLSYDIKNILTTVADASLDTIDTKQFITDMFKMLQRNNLILDHDVTMLIRGIGILESVLENLDSTISLLKVLKEHVLNSETMHFEPTKYAKKIGKKLYQSSKSLANIPNETESLLKSIQDGSFKFKFELSDSTKHIDKLESLIHELILGFIDGCLIIGYGTITTSFVRNIFEIAIIVVSVVLVAKMITDISHKGY